MRIFVTGATGFVGGFILKELRRQGYKVRCLVRDFEQAEKINANGTEAVIGDITDARSLEGVLTNCDAVIHLVAAIKEDKKQNITFERLHVEGTRNMINSARHLGVRRFLHMSALGADEHGQTEYYRTKGRAERLVRNSGLNYTIFRPSFIYGPGDGVYTMLAEMMPKLPWGLLPVFGIRTYRHQPVSVNDVAKGFVFAIENDRTFRRSYDVGGPQALTYKFQLRTVARVTGQKVRLFRVPMLLSRAGVAVASLFPSSPIDRDQLTMLTHNNICDPTPFSKDLRIDLTDFVDGINYLRREPARNNPQNAPVA